MNDQECFDYVLKTESHCYAAQRLGREALILSAIGSLGMGGEIGYNMVTSTVPGETAVKVFAATSVASMLAFKVSGMTRRYVSWKARRCIAKTGVDPREFLPGLSLLTDSEFQS